MSKLPIMTKKQFLILRDRHKTDQAIANLFGVSRQSVHQLRNKLGIDKCTNKTKKRNEAICWYCIHDRKPVETIANKYNLSISHVYRIIRDCKKKEG